MNAECGREASVLPPELDRNVCGEHIYSGVGIDSRLRIRRMGKHDQLHQAS